MQNNYLIIEDMLSLVSQMINNQVCGFEEESFFLSLCFDSHLDLDSNLFGLGLDSDSIVLVLDSTKVDFTTALIHRLIAIL